MYEKRHSPRIHAIFLICLLLLSVFLAGYMFWPFKHTITFSIVIGMLLHPIYLRLCPYCGDRRNTVALCMVLVLTIVILLPMLFFAFGIISQVISTVNTVNDWLAAGNLERLLNDPFIVDISATLKRLHLISADRLDIEGTLVDIGRELGQRTIQWGTDILGNTVGIVFRFFLMIFMVFFLVRDGSDIVRYLKHLLPLHGDQLNLIITKVRGMARSVFVGSLLTAICQGVAGGLGLAIVGIPALFWGTMMTLASLIPVVGTSIISIPAIGYLILLGKYTPALILTLWSIFIIGGIDNFIRPIFMRGGAEVSTFYIFLAIIGGVSVFGLPGLLYGPLILSFFLVMVSIYGEEYKQILDDMDRP